MGIVHSEIVLKNAWDAGNAEKGLVPEKEVRTVAVNALVDTSAGTLVINEEIRQRLGLSIKGLRESTLADGSKETYQVTEPVYVQWENRDTACMAVVIPDADNVLLGAIPLEDMDLIVDPVRQRLAGAHGDKVVSLIM
ncbi:MAG: retroviral-like aspartic protease family protein [Treponema sp.]|jgi:clan AA aspartic protease|nr:retroviral-like aspartic protease family protein [Treponema sp.]